MKMRATKFPGLVAVVLEAPLVVPKEWKRLLARLELGEAPRAQQGGARANDPEPYTDDSREASVKEGGLVVTARLCSGQTNYWMEWEVERDGKVVYSQTDVDYDVADGPVELYYDDEVLEFVVKLA
jgi:hypothetical protein